MKSLLNNAIADLQQLLPRLAELEPQLTRLGEAMFACWERKGKVLIAGNGGSAADAMHLAEELVARFMKNRRALAAIALCDPTIITCAANDFSYEDVFSRQIEALGNEGDVFIGLSTSGNSPNILKALHQARRHGMLTAGFLGKDGGKAKALCDIQLVVPAELPHRIQEAHKVLYHTLCEWIDRRVT